MQSIDSDCLFLIFSYLPGKINNAILSQVCKRWNNHLKVRKTPEVYLYDKKAIDYLRKHGKFPYTFISIKEYDYLVFSKYNYPDKFNGMIKVPKETLFLTKKWNRLQQEIDKTELRLANLHVKESLKFTRLTNPYYLYTLVALNGGSIFPIDSHCYQFADFYKITKINISMNQEPYTWVGIFTDDSLIVNGKYDIKTAIGILPIGYLINQDYLDIEKILDHVTEYHTAFSLLIQVMKDKVMFLRYWISLRAREEIDNRGDEKEALEFLKYIDMDGKTDVGLSVKNFIITHIAVNMDMYHLVKQYIDDDAKEILEVYAPENMETNDYISYMCSVTSFIEDLNLSKDERYLYLYRLIKQEFNRLDYEGECIFSTSLAFIKNFNIDHNDVILDETIVDINNIEALMAASALEDQGVQIGNSVKREIKKRIYDI